MIWPINAISVPAQICPSGDDVGDDEMTPRHPDADSVIFIKNVKNQHDKNWHGICLTGISPLSGYLR
jgi:hypothetical protein